MLEWLDTLLQWLQYHPHVAVWIVFLIALTESLAIIGLFVPGSVALAGIGVLVGTGVLPLMSTLIAATVGAIIGDVISFAIGAKYRHSILYSWPFCHFPQLFIKGEAFVAKHAGKSVFLGRFFGPVRPIIPIVAGMLKVDWKRFIFADICSGLLWAPAYIMPGILLTALAQTYAEQQAILVWLSLTLISWLLSKLWCSNIRYRWYLIVSQRFAIFANQLRLGNIFTLKELSQLLLIIVLSGLLLSLIALALLKKLTSIDQAVWLFFSQISITWFDHVMIGMTLLGERWSMLIVYLVVLSYLGWRRWWALSFYWFCNGALVVGSAWILKAILQVARPQALELRDTYSFPSAHTSLSIGLFGGLYMLLTAGYKALPPLHFGIFVLCAYLGMTRLYLNAHWLSDIIVGSVLGLWSLSLSAWLKPSKSPGDFNPYKLLLIASMSLAVAWLIHIIFYADNYWLEYQAMRVAAIL